MIQIQNLPEIKAAEIGDLNLNYIVFFPQFFKDWKKISFYEMREIYEKNRPNRSN